ncbi:MAG TPA: DNA-binding protein, partial [Gammaproteobacteria bacterium]|nr:DNA-binding protein [Gammaproteobacteria bacterium]
MSRPGVHYETIKQTAVKLLSQGVAPSVQKIREVLGTGSNSTIAEHLKIWREEYASKTIHHLPSSMPKELISAVEVLWHAAMEQASNHLSAIKINLNEQQEKVRLDKVAQEQTITHLQTSL